MSEEMQESSRRPTKEERDELLIKWGYYNKEYSDNDYRTDEYPFCEQLGVVTRWFKKVPYDVDDEEFEKITREVKENDEKEEKDKKQDRENNTIAIIFKVFGYLTFIAGFVLGIVLARVETGYYYETEFSFPLALAYWGGGFVSGMFMFAIAEVISLLNRIANNTEKADS